MRAVLLIATLSGCQAEGRAPAPAPRQLTVTAHGETVLRVVADRPGCGVDAVWTAGPGPVGLELSGPAGLVARVVDEPGPPRRLSILDPVGIAVVRARFDDSGVALTDAARTATGRLEAAGDGVTVLDGSGAATGAVAGTSDLALATVVTSQLPLEARARYACTVLVPPAAK